MSTPVDARLPTAPSLVPPLNPGANPAPVPQPSVGAGLFKHHADASNRLHAVLSFELNALLRKHALLDRLLNCSSEERDALGKAAQSDLPILRQEWESIRNDLILRSRARVLRSSSQKRARKPIGHLESSQTLVPATPKSGKPEQPRKPPSAWPARDLARRRVMRIDAMLTQDSSFNDAMLELLHTMGEQKATLASGGAGLAGAGSKNRRKTDNDGASECAFGLR